MKTTIIIFFLIVSVVLAKDQALLGVRSDVPTPMPKKLRAAFLEIGITMTESNGVVYEKKKKEYTFWNLSNEQADAIDATFEQNLENIINHNPNVVYTRNPKSWIWLMDNGYTKKVPEQ